MSFSITSTRFFAQAIGEQHFSSQYIEAVATSGTLCQFDYSVETLGVSGGDLVVVFVFVLGNGQNAPMGPTKNVQGQLSQFRLLPKEFYTRRVKAVASERRVSQAHSTHFSDFSMMFTVACFHVVFRIAEIMKNEMKPGYSKCQVWSSTCYKTPTAKDLLETAQKLVAHVQKLKTEQATPNETALTFEIAYE